MDLETIAIDCLKELGGDHVPVPGAKLASYISKRARALGIGDFNSMLRSQDLTFKGFIRKLNVYVVGYQGRDITVALTPPNAILPSGAPKASKTTYIRKDVYDAFTRIEANGYRYHVGSDRFQLPVEGALDQGIPVPPVTLQGLLTLRNAFIEKIEGTFATDAGVLRRAINSPNPLRRFTAAITATDRAGEWRTFLSEHLNDEITQWAMENHVTVRSEWFGDPPSIAKPGVESMAAGAADLRRLLNALPDEELRHILIPGHLLEKLLRR